MTDFISAGVLQDIVKPRKLFEEMEKRYLLECSHFTLLVLCLEQIERKDLVKKIKDFYSNHGILLQSKDCKPFSKHIFTLFSVSKMLTSDDLNNMKYLLLDEIKGQEKDNIDSPLQLFTAMLKKDIISETDDSRLQQLMEQIHRNDIKSKMHKEFSEDYLRLIDSLGLEHIMAKLSISPKVDDVDTHPACTPLERGDGQHHMLLVSHPEDESSLKFPEQAQDSMPSPPVAEDSWDSGTVLEYMSVEKMKEYCSENSLGSGGFGEVFKGSKKYRDKEVAIKVCKKAKKEHELQYVKEKIVGHIRHPFLLPLYAVAATQKEIYLMYPYMEKRDLDYVLKNTSPVPGWCDRCRIIYQVCAGLQYLHTPVKSGGVKIRNSILHMDIKPSNILLDQELNARIGDHGLATEMKSKQSKVTAIGHGAVSYQDPDFLYSSYKNKYRKEYDVFSVGVVMLRLMQAEQDEDEDDDEDNKSYIWEKFRNEDGTCCDVEKVTDKAQKDLPGIWPVRSEKMFKCTYKFAELALKCIKKPIANRISLDDLQDSIREQGAGSTHGFSPDMSCPRGSTGSATTSL
ncbi:cysteine-rich receptor-like protein kinase 7 [Lingula anatina]|uniref:Cysteine-rich receptor-like protein kinase 7 n=1 Tax=Lingula anatina TaxID=7574 RepID=A0A1S3H7G5_LINAN|nr:cysteine-rich receptor-like protein kinase 7 [Lingula anatina]|eukprot:XP_013382060.1 cysteine-rich receptor-like protein kinase 7 [Lingula anatina]